MLNIQDFIAENKTLRTFKVDDLLFAEFKRPVKAFQTFIWCENDFFSFIMEGSATFKTPRNEVSLQTGDCVFVKKGSILIESEIQKEICELMVFVTDNYMKALVNKHKISLVPDKSGKENHRLIPFNENEVVRSYFYTLLNQFNQAEAPPDALIKRKFEELMVSILSGNKKIILKNYLYRVAKSEKPGVKEIMENNFTFDLTLPEFARLTARSLSSFKNDFYKIYRSTPGKWIQKMRLEYSRYLMDESGYTFDEIATMSGFANKIHFNKVFKSVYGVSPAKYRMRER